ncbi:hypothetical protein OH809_41145 [Streptomyces sp. NBC_00873]|uniref:hypothetical protein n=1 Tax=Streptomyces sp. NBC_00873 TaxID=2975852 RepID=UPI00386BEAA3|nr:hypothetical protein OH809_41145 [Streptomyces sp. NBC_00873]
MPPSAKRRAEERGARNTRVNRGTTRDRFEEWCVKEGRIARPATTTANVVAYFDHLMESGKKGGSQYSPDSLLAYLSRIVTLQIVRRVRAWLGDLRELDADNPTFPLFQALSTTGNLKGRGNATVRGLHLSGSAINEIVKKRAAAAGVTYINGLKVTGHSLRAGPNTDMKRAKVPLADRREAGDWGEKSPLPDSRYNRPDDTVDATETDPLDAVPLFGRFQEETAGR